MTKVTSQERIEGEDLTTSKQTTQTRIFGYKKVKVRDLLVRPR